MFKFILTGKQNAINKMIAKDPELKRWYVEFDRLMNLMEDENNDS